MLGCQRVGSPPIAPHRLQPLDHGLVAEENPIHAAAPGGPEMWVLREIIADDRISELPPDPSLRPPPLEGRETWSTSIGRTGLYALAVRFC